MNYYKVPNKSEIAKEVLEFALCNELWQSYYNFKAVQIPDEIVAKDPFLLSLRRAHPFMAGIVKLDPNVCYDWHTDTRRGVGVNMLLNFEGRSHCLFAQDEGVQFKFDELVYTPNRYYLFNTQKRHTVLNFEEPRYLFTIEFLEDKDQLSFDSLYHQIKKNPTW
jgi:hypothetical protein